MDISEKIVSSRKAKGYTQQALADKANLALSTIKRIESGKSNPRIHTLYILSDILDIELLPKVSEYKGNNKKELVVMYSVLLSIAPPLNLLYLFRLNPKRREIENKLLVFQVSSFIIFIVSLFVITFLTYITTGEKIYGQINTPQILYLLYVLINLISGLSIIRGPHTLKDTLKPL